MVAGCVGEYWTDIHEAHLMSMDGLGASLRPLGVRFGKGLQLINILRDLPEDLKNGRCYLPQQELGQLGLGPRDLIYQENNDRVVPLFRHLMGVCSEHLQAGTEYLRRLPIKELRLRLCTTWPLVIAQKTLRMLRTNPQPLNPQYRIKIPRKAVYRLVANSVLHAPIPGALESMTAGTEV